MEVNPVEAVADAIMDYEGWRPGSRSYRNRNPGNLRDSPMRYGEDQQGYAQFTSFQAGYTALCTDLLDKFNGHNSHGLSLSSTLLELMEVYAPTGDANDPHAYAHFVAAYLTRALGQPVWITSTLAAIAPYLMDSEPYGGRKS